jgi:hypothetical protein
VGRAEEKDIKKVDAGCREFGIGRETGIQQEEVAIERGESEKNAAPIMKSTDLWKGGKRDEYGKRGRKQGDGRLTFYHDGPIVSV